MEIKDFKKVARLLKEIYKEIEEEANKNGMDIFSTEYEELISKAREVVLEKMGFTLEEYREAKRNVVSEQKEELGELLQEAKTIIDKVSNIKIPTPEEIEETVNRLAKEHIKEVVVTRETIKEIEKPIFVTETIIQKGEYDDSKLHEELQKVNKKFEDLPEPIDVEKIKEETLTEFGKMFEDKINILGMPDFRKLAMGLKQQIDDMETRIESGDVDSVSNSDGTLTISPTTGTVIVSRAAITGDVTIAGGSNTSVLATVNANVGSFGSSTSIPSFTVNAKGLITAASTNAVIAPAGTLTGTTLASNVVTSSLTSVGTLGGLTITAAPTFSAMTLGSVLFAGTAGLLSQDNTNFNYTPASRLLTLDATGTGTCLHTGPAAGTTNAVVGGAGVEIVGTNNTTGGMNLILGNKSAGTSAFVDIFLQNDLADATGTHFAVINLNSSTYNDTSFGTAIAVPNQFGMYGTDGPMLIGTTKVGSFLNIIIGGSAIGNEVGRFNTSGLQVKNGTAAAPSLNFASATTTGLYRGGADTIGFSIAGTSRGTWTAATLSTNFSGGLTLDMGGTAQGMDFGGTIVPTAATFQTVRTTAIWAPDVNRTNGFAFNNSFVLGGSTTGLTLGTACANRSAVSTSAGSGIGITITDVIMFEARSFVNNSSGTVVVTNQYGFYANNMSDTVSTNKYGFYGAMAADTTKWNIFMPGTAQNHLRGNLGIGSGITAPTAKLHIAAGATAASSAPIKLTTGTSMTAAEAGAVEFTTDDLFFTITTGPARKRLLMADPVGGLTSGRVPFVTTNGRLTDDADMTFATDTLTVTKIDTTSIQTDTVVNDTGLAHGVYTPTRSAEANMDSNVTTSEAQYMRVGNTVTVSGRFTADPTLTATATSFEITLPVASNIGAVEDLAGVAFCGTIAGMGAAISGSVAGNTAVFSWVATDVTSQSWSYTFSYQVI